MRHREAAERGRLLRTNLPSRRCRDVGTPSSSRLRRATPSGTPSLLARVSRGRALIFLHILIRRCAAAAARVRRTTTRTLRRAAPHRASRCACARAAFRSRAPQTASAAPRRIGCRARSRGIPRDPPREVVSWGRSKRASSRFSLAQAWLRRRSAIQAELACAARPGSDNGTATRTHRLFDEVLPPPGPGRAAPALRTSAQQRTARATRLAVDRRPPDITSRCRSPARSESTLPMAPSGASSRAPIAQRGSPARRRSAARGTRRAVPPHASARQRARRSCRPAARTLHGPSTTAAVRRGSRADRSHPLPGWYCRSPPSPHRRPPRRTARALHHARAQLRLERRHQPRPRPDERPRACNGAAAAPGGRCS